MSDGPTSSGLARRPAVVLAGIALTVFVALAAIFVPWSWVPGGDLSPLDSSDLFSRSELARAEEFAATRRYLSWASYFCSLAVALLLGLTRWGAQMLRRTMGGVTWLVAVPLNVLLLLLVGRLVTLPFAIAVRQRNLDYGLTYQGVGGWSLDLLKSLLVSWISTALLLLVVVALARRSPRYWFAWAGALAMVLATAGSFFYPVLVEPLFNKFTPMASGSFKDSVFALADEEGVAIEDVLVADASRRTTTVNAYVSGFGATRRVVVYDNLLTQLSEGEARVVIAHELGHAKNHDVVLGTGLGAVGSVFGVCLLALVLDSRHVRRRAGVRGPADPAGVALVLALVAVGAFVASPVQNTISRAIEARADRVSLEVTGQDDVFIAMQRELSIRSISDPTPPTLSQFWFGSHPTTLQRAGLPDSLARANR